MRATPPPAPPPSTEALLAAGDVTLRWTATANSPYVYNLAYPETGPITDDRVYHARDKDLAATTATYNSMAGTATDHIEWYGGVVAPTTPLDDNGEQTLAAERQGDLIGVAPGFWGDGQHQGVQGSFGDIGNMVLKRNGETIGESYYPFGVFTVPHEESSYELTLNTAKFGISARAWKRSTETSTTWSFRSALDEDAYAQGVPLLFPHYDLPEDGLKTLPAKDGQRIALSVTGHEGYEPGALTSVKLAYSSSTTAQQQESKSH